MSDADDKTRILLIDVIQSIDGQIVVETVQKNEGEAYASLRIEGLPIEQLVQNYRKIAELTLRQTEQRNAALVVTMSPSSPTSGELQAVVEKQNSGMTNSVQVNYRHYYLLNALREKMIEQLGEDWRKVMAVYREENVEFYFDY